MILTPRYLDDPATVCAKSCKSQNPVNPDSDKKATCDFMPTAYHNPVNPDSDKELRRPIRVINLLELQTLSAKIDQKTDGIVVGNHIILRLGKMNVLKRD